MQEATPLIYEKYREFFTSGCMKKPEQISGVTTILTQGMLCWIIRPQREDTAVERNPMALPTRINDWEEREELVLLLATIIGGVNNEP